MGLGEIVNDTLNMGYDIYNKERETAVAKKQAELEAQKAIEESKAKATIAQSSLAESNTRRYMYMAIGLAIFALIVIMVVKAKRG